jgi:hypothetical protein
MKNLEKLYASTFILKSAARGDQLRKALTALLIRAKHGNPVSSRGAISRLDAFGKKYPILDAVTDPPHNPNGFRLGEIPDQAKNISSSLLHTLNTVLSKSKNRFTMPSPARDFSSIFGRGVKGRSAVSKIENSGKNNILFPEDSGQNLLQDIPTNLFKV